MGAARPETHRVCAVYTTSRIIRAFPQCPRVAGKTYPSQEQLQCTGKPTCRRPGKTGIRWLGRGELWRVYPGVLDATQVCKYCISSYNQISWPQVHTSRRPGARQDGPKSCATVYTPLCVRMSMSCCDDAVWKLDRGPIRRVQRPTLFAPTGSQAVDQGKLALREAGGGSATINAPTRPAHANAHNSISSYVQLIWEFLP